MDDARPDLPPVYHTGERQPFDPDDPPRRPPASCVDPTLWEVAVALHEAHRPGVDGWCACRLFHPCPAWRRAVSALRAACASDPGTPPRLFTLCDDRGTVSAYGMTLPDRSAVTVEWTGVDRGAVGFWSSPAAPARLWGWSVVWPGPPR